jgi:hypothetical protein
LYYIILKFQNFTSKIKTTREIFGIMSKCQVEKGNKFVAQ